MVVNGNRFVELLREASYDKNEIEFIEKDFSKGFEIGYEGPTDRQQEARNLPFCYRSREALSVMA